MKLTSLLAALIATAFLMNPSAQAGNAHVAGGIERVALNTAGTVVTTTTINVNALENPQGVHGHFSLRAVRASAATGAILSDTLIEADIYDILVLDNAAFIAGIITRYVINGTEVDLEAQPGRMMIKLTDNGEGQNAASDTQSLLALWAEEFVNDPEFPFNFDNEELLDLLSSRALPVTSGNFAVQN